MQNKRTIIIFCEGESEYAYIQELNRFLRENEYGFAFVPKVIGTGVYSEVLAKYKEEHKDNPRTLLRIMLDDDIYVRNDNDRERENSVKLSGSPIRELFLFNVHNFEDFMVMHCDDEVLNRWLTTCVAENHQKVPMHSVKYMPLIQCFFPGYEKGSCPLSPIRKDMLDNLFNHNDAAAIFLKSGFATFLKGLLAVK